MSRQFVPVYLADYWEAFQTLSPSRPSSLTGAGPIQLSEIRAFCAIRGIEDPEEVADIVLFVRTLDLEYLGWVSRLKKR